jgi:hypothetical protein
MGLHGIIDPVIAIFIGLVTSSLLPLTKISKIQQRVIMAIIGAICGWLSI